MPDPVAPLVECAALAHRFGSRWALRGVSVSVQPGEVVGVIGANGSGKSTLLRILATALRPTRGGGTVCGLDLLREASAIRSRIAWLGHGSAVYDDLTAEENLRFALQMAGQSADVQRIGDAFDRVGLGAERRERVRHLSAGNRRRVALARLLLRPASLLLLDEPYTSFDDEGVACVNTLLNDARSRGAATLIVTHDLDRVSDVIDRTLRLVQGVTAANADEAERDPSSGRPSHLRLSRNG